MMIDTSWYIKELARAGALISWINGACVDELPHTEIRAAIDRYIQESGET